MFSTGLATSGGLVQKAERGHSAHCNGRRLWAVNAVLVGLGLSVGVACMPLAEARSPQAVEGVPLNALPAQAQKTYRLIFSGGPFPYVKDGIVFGNRERQLPPKARGYYREYTVKTPDAGNRGARRIVCGGKPPTQPEACYYTDDHYASFRQIVQ